MFVIAVSGLIYELLAGALSSYLLGDSVYQFSLVIGLFMTAMGLGAYLSRFIEKNLERAFVITQIALGVSGGLSALLLFYVFTYLDNYSAFLFLICIIIGTLMGLEIPLITRILQHHRLLQFNISNVLTFDYIGALVAALLFPLVLVPQLGLMSTALVFGLLNLVVAGMAYYLFRQQIEQGIGRVAVSMMVSAIVLSGCLWYSNSLIQLFETRLYQDEIIFAETTPYQRIVVTRHGERFQLFINGGLQFDSIDEYRYHEALVHPVMGLTRRHESILIIGGGDGMAVREVLKYADAKQITLVDLDPVMTGLFRDNPLLNELNTHALQDERVSIINQDAWKYLENTQTLYDVIIIDLPDPHNPSLSKLYSRAFYAMLVKRLSLSGLLVTQATSPLYAREAFWCIHNTLAATPSPYRYDETLYTIPYHSYVPSFGEWGFVVAGSHQPDWNNIQLPQDVLQFLTPQLLPTLTAFPPDMQALPSEINTLQAHPLLQYYEQGWSRWFP